MQQEEEEVNRKRAANRTALEAIGGSRKKRKLDEALESLQNDKTPANNSSTPTSSATSTPQVGILIRSRSVLLVLPLKYAIIKQTMMFCFLSERTSAPSSHNAERSYIRPRIGKRNNEIFSFISLLY